MSRRMSDLAVVIVLAVVAPVALLLPGVPRVVEWLLGVPFLLVLPGYAIVAAAFPETPRPEVPRTPDWAGRFALSLAASAVAVATVGVFLSATFGIHLVTVVSAISAVAVAGSVLAALRRLVYPPERRADPLGDGALGAVLAGFGGSTLQSSVAVVAVLVLAVSVGYAVTAPPQEEPFSEAYLLVENDDGDLVAENYPETVVAGEGASLFLAIENHEHRRMSYTTVVVAQTVQPDGTVTGQRHLDQFGVTTGPGEQAVVERTVTPTTPADGVRLQFLIYKGSVPADPGTDNADVSVHLWVDVLPEGSA